MHHQQENVNFCNSSLNLNYRIGSWPGWGANIGSRPRTGSRIGFGSGTLFTTHQPHTRLMVAMAWVGTHCELSEFTFENYQVFPSRNM